MKKNVLNMIKISAFIVFLVKHTYTTYTRIL